MIKIYSLLLLLFLGGCTPESNTLTVKEIPSEKEVPAKIILGWTPPTEYTNGEPLPIDMIGGYKIYLSNISNYYRLNSLTIDIPNGYIMEVEVTSLIPNTYYAVMTCYTIDNIESSYSNEVSFTTE